MAINLDQLPSLPTQEFSSSFKPSSPSQRLEPFYRMALEGALKQSGSKPVIPEFKITDVNKYNQQAMGKATEINRTNFEQLGQMVRQANPYFDQQNAQIAKNTMADLQGVLPQDVIDRYRNLAAARTTGTGGEQRSNLTLRDLGRSSLDRMDVGRQASQQFGDYMKRQLVPDLAGVEEFMFSPALELQQNQQLFNRDLLASQVAAGPDPQQAALGQVMETFSGLLAGNALTKPIGSPVSQNIIGLGGGGGGGGGGINNATSGGRKLIGSGFSSTPFLGPK